VTATARKLAILVYRMLKVGTATAYDQRQRTRILHGLRKRATSLGLELVDPSTGLVA